MLDREVEDFALIVSDRLEVIFLQNFVFLNDLDVDKRFNDQIVDQQELSKIWAVLWADEPDLQVFFFRESLNVRKIYAKGLVLSDPLNFRHEVLQNPFGLLEFPS
jgi:hypothetical protein